MASALAGKPAAFVNADVALDSEPVIGSFTVDGLTFAVTDESHVELVGVSPDWQQVTSSQEGEDASVAPMLASGSEESANLALPESVTYEDIDYALASIAPYAFYLSGVTDVTLPASVNDVDDRAFRSSDVANVAVAGDNPSFSSYDGVLYDAALTRLLLIPGGRQGAVRISSKAEEVDASAFSHCAGVDSISVDAGSAHLSSWEGLLYDADGTTLLRVPAGATEITIREGCTTIAAGALEACANLERINAPTTVTSISPDVFTSVPTVSLPSASVILSGAAEDDSAEDPQPTEAHEAGNQITAMVALSTTDDDLPKVNPASIMVDLPEGASLTYWAQCGFSPIEKATMTSLQSAIVADAAPSGIIHLVANGGYFELIGSWSDTATVIYEYFYGNWDFSGGSQVVAWFNAAGQWTAVKPVRAGYTAYGWRGTVDFAWVEGDYTGTTDIYEEVQWVPNDYAISFDVNGGKDAPNSKPADVTATFDAALPAIGANKPVRDGYTFNGWYDTSAATGGNMYYDAENRAVPGKVWDRADNTTLYARWAPNSYTIAFDSQGGPEVASMPATYDSDVTLPQPGAREGYTFGSWNTKPDGSGTAYQAGIALAKPNLATNGMVTLHAQWAAIEEAVVPLEVTARVDVLGIEDQTPATGYIESRCGEPLKVASVEFTSLPGAAELFGAGNESQVQLQVLAGEGAAWQPDGANAAFSFPLGASATESDAGKLAAFTMQAYGDRISISYRFSIPEALQLGLAETTKPICSVAYTVALA